LHFFTINNVFYSTHRKKCLYQTTEKSRIVKSAKGEGRECAPLPSQRSRNTLSRKAQNTGRREVVHHLSGKIFPEGHDAKKCSAS
jgi:hypothetical protein